MLKNFELEELSYHDEPTIQIVRPGEYNRLGHVKTATEALDYIKHIKPQPGKTIILLLAMTADEFYGSNRNGDSWLERPAHIGPTYLGPETVLPKWYNTFEDMANVFKHHINKDPEKRIGEVIKSFYNWHMHRVELVVSLDNKRAEHFVEAIERGEFLPVSMGCRILYDVCSVCGHKAPTTKDYCVHARYRMNELLPNGMRVRVFNPSPMFYDISFVVRPADRHGFMMKKVADNIPEIRSSAKMGEYIFNLQQKSSTARKLSVIKKIIDGEAVVAKDKDGLHGLKSYAEHVGKPFAKNTRLINKEELEAMLSHKPSEVLSTLKSMDLMLTIPELFVYFAKKLDPLVTITEELVRRVGDCQDAIFKALSENPDILNEVESTGASVVTDENVSPVLKKKLSKLAESRSPEMDYLYEKITPDLLKPYERKGNWDVLEVRDPTSGKVYQTTRGAQHKARDAAVERRTGKALGGAGLLAGAAGLTLLPGPLRSLGKVLAPVAAVPGAVMTYQSYKGYPSTETTTGDTVYAPQQGYLADKGYRGTELVQKRAQVDARNFTKAACLFALSNLNFPKTGVKIAFDPTQEGSFDTLSEALGRAICP